MYKLINGYTKESLKELILKHNKGKPASYECLAEEDDEYHCKGDVISDYCVYFNPVDENRCAIGCCLPDSFIEMNRSVVSDEIDVATLVRDYPELGEHMPFDITGCTRFQDAHDSDGWKKTGLTFHEHLCKWIDENACD